jgi:hypothetical protein
MLDLKKIDGIQSTTLATETGKLSNYVAKIEGERPSQQDLADKDKNLQEVQQKLRDAHARPSVAMHTSLKERLAAMEKQYDGLKASFEAREIGMQGLPTDVEYQQLQLYIYNSTRRTGLQRWSASSPARKTMELAACAKPMPLMHVPLLTWPVYRPGPAAATRSPHPPAWGTETYYGSSYRRRRREQ